MIKKYTNKTITWIDAETPTITELQDLMQEYSLDPSVMRDLQLPTYKEKIIAQKDYLYLVMHFPALNHSSLKDDVDQEIDFVVGRDFIITARYENIDALERFQKIFEVNTILDKHMMEDHAGYVLYYIIKELYKNIGDEVDTINDSIKNIKGKVFEGKEKEMVFSISKINKDLLHLNHTTKTHEQILEGLSQAGERIFDGDFKENCEKILNEYYRIQDLLTQSTEFLKEIRGTNDSLLNTKQNEIMKTLTIIAFLALPFSIITGFFQLNASGKPTMSASNDWGIIIAIEIVVMIVLFVFAKIKKWL
jgi:magnesium transporter